MIRSEFARDDMRATGMDVDAALAEDDEPEAEIREEEDGNAGRGCVVALLLALVFWALVAGAGVSVMGALGGGL